MCLLFKDIFLFGGELTFVGFPNVPMRLPRTKFEFHFFSCRRSIRCVLYNMQHLELGIETGRDIFPTNTKKRHSNIVA